MLPRVHRDTRNVIAKNICSQILFNKVPESPSRSMDSPVVLPASFDSGSGLESIYPW